MSVRGTERMFVLYDAPDPSGARGSGYQYQWRACVVCRTEFQLAWRNGKPLACEACCGECRCRYCGGGQ